MRVEGLADAMSSKKPATLGRPPVLLDDAKKARVIAAVRLGQGRNEAAASAGVARSTLFDALARGRRGDPLFADFADAVKAAEAFFERRALSRITKASRGTWQAAAWLLERKHPDRWAVHKEIRQHVTKDASTMTKDERRAELARLKQDIADEERRLDEAGRTIQ